MRVLSVVHYYLPRHQAGTELYTRALVRNFKREGHEVAVFTSEDSSRPGFKLERDEYEGVPVYRIFHSGTGDFRAGYVRPEFDQLFGETLDQLKPEIIHFQHLYRLSNGFVAEASKRKIPTVLTLADYWMICPAIIMLKPEDAPCLGPEGGEACARCPHAFSAFSVDRGTGARAWLARGMEAGLSLAHKLKRRLPPAMVDTLRKKVGKQNEVEKSLALLKDRWSEMRKAVDGLSLLIAPSKFLMEMMIKNGMAPREKIIFSDYGFEGEWSKPGKARERKGGPVVFGFIGTLVKHKGLMTLLEALNALPAEDIELKIFGDPRDFPGYVRMLKKVAGNDRRIEWKGRVEHDRIAEALNEIDVLVVPSLWYENSPLTIHEAFMAGVPVVASNIGGMRELIEEGGGLLFEVGNHLDLSEKIKQIAATPETLDKLRKSIPPVKSIDENYQELLIIYQMLVKNI